MQIDLSKYRINHYSQNGEDGVIEKLFELMGIKDGWLVEFGAWNGVHLSNIHYHASRNHAFKTMRIEGVEERFNEMTKLVPWNEGNILLNLYVEEGGPNSLNALFAQYGVDKIALLSIDVDGPDLLLWNSLDTTKYRPALVIIEEGKWADVDALINLEACFWEKGYQLIHVTGNFIFIDNKAYPNIQAVDAGIFYLLHQSGNPEYALFHKWISQEEFDAIVKRFSEPDIFVELAGEQIIEIKDQHEI